MTERPAPLAPALGSLAALGAAYAGFSALLAARGISPRAVLLPIEPAQYYAAQALFVGPLFVGLAWLFARTTLLLAGTREVTPREAFAALAPRYAWPLLVLFVLPDLGVFLVAGHGALAKAMRYYAPLAPIAITVLAARHVQSSWGVSRLRAAAPRILLRSSASWRRSLPE